MIMSSDLERLDPRRASIASRASVVVVTVVVVVSFFFAAYGWVFGLVPRSTPDGRLWSLLLGTIALAITTASAGLLYIAITRRQRYLQAARLLAHHFDDVARGYGSYQVEEVAFAMDLRDMLVRSGETAEADRLDRSIPSVAP
jgi:hypothetical protein